MKKKEITGISIERDLLRLATLTMVRDKIRITKVQTFRLNEPVYRRDGLSVSSQDDQNVNEDEDAIFGFDAVEDAPVASAATEDDQWDMTEDGVGEQFQNNANSVQFANILTTYNTNSIQLALTIPSGFTHFQIVDKINPKKVGKKKFNDDLKGTLVTMYGHDIGDEQFRYHLKGSNSILLSSIESEIPGLRLVDEASPFYKGKISVREIAPEESLLMGLVRANYQVSEHQYTCIVHVDEQSTRIIFMHGREFHSILPEINEGSKSGRVTNTIFSKILFELDRGKIPTLDRIVITGHTIKGKLEQFLRDQFLDVEIDAFEFSGDRVEVLESVAGEYRTYTLAIAAAWSAIDANKQDFLPLNFVPKYVLTRQQVFKLDWHGYLLLFLIALTPVVLNHYYNQRKNHILENEQVITQLNQQTEQVRLIANEVDRLTAELITFNNRVDLLDTLSYNSLKWSRTLGIINNSAQTIRGYWIRNIQGTEENLIVQGTALHRDRIPQLSNSFSTAIIQQVTERQYRGITVYDFTILVTQIVNDHMFFKPQQVMPPDDLIDIEEVNQTGTIEY